MVYIYLFQTLSFYKPATVVTVVVDSIAFILFITAWSILLATSAYMAESGDFGGDGDDDGGPLSK